MLHDCEGRSSFSPYFLLRRPAPCPSVFLSLSLCLGHFVFVLMFLSFSLCPLSLYFCLGKFGFCPFAFVYCRCPFVFVFFPLFEQNMLELEVFPGENALCLFLVREDLFCRAYDVRPPVCNNFPFSSPRYPPSPCPSVTPLFWCCCFFLLLLLLDWPLANDHLDRPASCKWSSI